MQDRTSTNTYLCAALALSLLTLTGCGDSRPRTYDVDGKLRFDDDRAVRFAFVEFVPETGGPPCRGAVAKDGSFQLGTFDENDGAIAGKYKVVVIQHVPTEMLVAATGEHATHSALGIVDSKYSRSDTTPLRFEVSADGSNECNFTLERRPDPGE